MNVAKLRFYLLPSLMIFALESFPSAPLKSGQVLRIFKARRWLTAYAGVSSSSSWRAAESSRSLIRLFGGLAGLCLNQFSEIFGRIATFVGKVGW